MMRASNGDNSDCHLPFISDGLNFEHAINKTSVSESSDSLGNQANPVPSGLVATPEFITVSGSDSAFPFTQSNGLQSFQTISDVNDSLLGTVATNDILPQNTLQSQVDSLLGGSNDVYMSTMDNLDANLQQSSSDFKNAPDAVVIINLRDYEKTSVSSLSSPGTPPIDSPSSPNNLIIDADTQASLIQRSENLNLETLEGNPLTPNTTSANGLWGVLDESAVDELPCKAHKPDKNSDAPSSLRATHSSESETLDVDRITAMSAADFAFSKIEPQTSGAQFTFGTQSFATSVTNTELKNAKVSTVSPILKHTDVGQKANSNGRSAQRKTKEPSLSTQFPIKSHGFELRILEQPEEQHRARYMTEGSRGAVKDQTQQGYPVVQLFGPVQTALLQVFVGTDTGKVKPHPFYQACKVSGKNSTPCTERDIDSTTTIEIELSSTNDLMASIDCVGILKLRNADVEQRIGVAKTKKRSTRARMVFRVIFNRPDGVQQILQVTSSPIVCTQPVGQPEVSRLSLTACSVKGGKDLFIIGKNFMKGTKVFFREAGEDNKVIWEKEADIEKDYFQPTHLICVIPEYFNLDITKPVSVNLVVSCSGKLGDPRPFTYQPLKPLPKVETPMEVEPPQPQPLPFGQCPNTLELLRLLQQNPQGGFQVPSETHSPAFPSVSTVPQSSSSFSDRESTSETKCAFSPSFHEHSHQSDSQFASQLESSSNFHTQTPVQNSPVQSPPQLHSSTQFQSSNPSQPSTDQAFQQTTQLQSSTDDYLSTTQMTPSNQMHSSTMEMHTNDDYQTAATQQQQQQQQSTSSQQLNSSLTDFHSMSEMTDSNSIKSSPMLTNNSSQFQTQTFSFDEATALLHPPPPPPPPQQQQQLHASSQMNMSNTHIQFQPSQQQSNSQMNLSGSGLHLNMVDSNQFQTPLKMPMTNSISKLTSHQPQPNPLQSIQCQSENQALGQTQFQVESQTQPSTQPSSTQFSQLMSSALPSASAPQIIIVGNPRPVSGRNNVFSLGGNSQQPAPSIFIIPSLSTINENAVSQQDNDVLSLLDSLLRGNNCNNNMNHNNNNNNNDDNQLLQQQQQQQQQ